VLEDRTADSDVYTAKGLAKSLLRGSAILDLELIKRIVAVNHSSQLSPKDTFPSLFKNWKASTLSNSVTMHSRSLSQLRREW
jgi:hypothetical protein